MQTLTINLPDAAYQAALSFPKHERDRLFAVAITTAQAAYEEQSDEETNEEPDYDRPTNEADLEAIGRGLRAAEAGDVIPGDVFFAQLREQLRRK